MARTGRYSGYIRPFLYAMDLLLIAILAYFLLDLGNNIIAFVLLMSITWVFSALKSGFYEVYRYTPLTRIFYLVFIQLLLFILAVFAFFGFSSELAVTPWKAMTYVCLLYTSPSPRDKRQSRMPSSA